MVKNDSSVRILLAEPDLKEASDISMALQNSFDATVVYCKRAEQVLKKLESDDGIYDAVISELSLSDMSGIDLHIGLRDRRMEIPFILLLDISESDQAVSALKSGVDAYVVRERNRTHLEILPMVILKEIQRKQDGACIVQANDALRDSESKYRSMMEAMKDPVYICSPDFYVSYMNPAMVSRIGYNAVGEPCYKAIHNQKSACPWCFRKTVPDSEPHDHEILSPRDSRIYHITSTPIFHQDKTVSRMNIFRDITSQKRMEKELIALKNVAEEANIAKTEFLTNISHEIRTPLNVVLGMLDLLQTAETDPKQKEYLDTAKISADSLKIIIDDILDYSKIESGRMTLIKNDFNLRLLMEEISSVMTVRVQEKNLEFSCVIQPDVPDMITADSKRLRQILDNIIDNAVKFTEKGSIDVTVSIDKDRKRDYLHFVISDTGIGIPKKKQDLIFKGFTQADGSVTRRYGGTGLGLAISKNLAEMMEGKIRVEDRKGGGSAFHFTVPLSDKKKEKDKTGSRPAKEKHLRILLAEDNPFNQKLIDAILKTKGYDVMIAENGRIALELFEKHPFDLILMDIQMPELDGFQTTRALRSFEKEKGGHIPIIAITAYSMSGDKEKCLQAGMDEYLRKPIQRELLLSTILEFSERKTEPESAAPYVSLNDRILNRKTLMEVVGNNSDLVKELIRIYFDNLPKLISQIENGIANRNGHDIQFGAHALKGMSYNISAQRVAEAAHELEKTGRSENLSVPLAEQQFKILKEETEILKKAADIIKNSL